MRLFILLLVVMFGFMTVEKGLGNIEQLMVKQNILIAQLNKGL